MARTPPSWAAMEATSLSAPESKTRSRPSPLPVRSTRRCSHMHSTGPPCASSATCVAQDYDEPAGRCAVVAGHLLGRFCCPDFDDFVLAAAEKNFAATAPINAKAKNSTGVIPKDPQRPSLFVKYFPHRFSVQRCQ
jgi:hypothetical protein